MAISYVFIGGWLFQFIDPAIADLPYYLQVQFSFEVATTIGWGDLVPKTPWGKMATVVYQVF